VSCHGTRIVRGRKIGAYLIEHFVSIKMDREERPEVDKIYHDVRAIHDRLRRLADECFPHARSENLLRRHLFSARCPAWPSEFFATAAHIYQLWETRREDLNDSAIEIHARMEQMAVTGPEDEFQPAAHRRGASQCRFDDSKSLTTRVTWIRWRAKISAASQPQFLLRYATRFHDDEAIRMVLHTLRQDGGGWHSRSTRRRFLALLRGRRMASCRTSRKCSNDNAQLAQLYLDAYLVSGDVRHAEVARDILDYVRRDMTHPDGGFYSAEDADSEGIEGKFYCWTREELSKLLMAGGINVAVRYFGITERGTSLITVIRSRCRPKRIEHRRAIGTPISESARFKYAGTATSRFGDRRSAREHRF